MNYLPSHKICNRCQINKTAKHFRIKVDNRCGKNRITLYSECKDCDRERAAIYYSKVKDNEEFKIKNRNRQKEYQSKNCDEIKRRRQLPEYAKKHAELNLKSYYRNRDFINAKQKIKRQTPEYKAMMKRYREKNKTKIYEQEKITKRRYSEKHRDQLTDLYVASKLAAQTPLSRNEIPPALIKLKRLEILCKRSLKLKTNESRTTS